MITLDWDNITIQAALKIIQKIQSDPLTSDILLALSPMKHGFHVYVNSYYHLSIERVLKLRNKWHDDKNRLLADWENLGESQRNVLFSCKIKNGKRYEEEPMYFYKREKEGSMNWSTKSIRHSLSQLQLSLPTSSVRSV